MWKFKGLNVRWHLASGSWLSQFATWLARCFTSCFVCLSSFLYPHYISPHYPRNCKESFREKTLEIHLRVRDCKPTILNITFKHVQSYKWNRYLLNIRLVCCVWVSRDLFHTQIIRSQETYFMNRNECIWLLTKVFTLIESFSFDFCFSYFWSIQLNFWASMPWIFLYFFEE